MIYRPLHGKIESLFQPRVGLPLSKNLGDSRRFEEMLQNCSSHLIGRNKTLNAQVAKHVFQPIDLLGAYWLIWRF